MKALRFWVLVNEYIIIVSLAPNKTSSYSGIRLLLFFWWTEEEEKQKKNDRKKNKKNKRISTDAKFLIGHSFHIASNFLNDFIRGDKHPHFLLCLLSFQAHKNIRTSIYFPKDIHQSSLHFNHQFFTVIN